jgi:hypothetical protein
LPGFTAASVWMNVPGPNSGSSKTFETSPLVSDGESYT